MTVRVRFAPSPTGYLHIGGARTALYSYLFARAQGGTFILRIEDTDLERSKREYELAQIDDLKWVGITYDEGPDCGGPYGPYRQSERLDLYQKYAWQLVDAGMAYPCFLTEDELAALTAKAEAEKKSPHAYHGKYRSGDLAEARKRIAAGEPYVIRFKNPQKPYHFKDLVRGDVHFQEDMVGDFVIIRTNGLPVYNFCCVIDDVEMKITHVIRAEEHLNNTVRQLMIYEAIKAPVPEFAHVSLLIGEDRQKLSKRHGATSVSQYRDENYLPEALINYLCLLGWSHPDETDIFSIDELGAKFDLTRFSKSPALYDVQKLKFFNEQHLRRLPTSALREKLIAIAPTDHLFPEQTPEWQDKFIELYKEKIQLLPELLEKTDEVFRVEMLDEPEFQEAMSWETTPQIREFLKKKLDDPNLKVMTEELYTQWMDALKNELKIKGKPLFMGSRAVLTGVTHGPDLKILMALTPISVLRERLTLFS